MQSPNDLCFLLLLLLLLLLFLLAVLRKLKETCLPEKSPKNLPPCPRRLPLLGNLHQLDLGKPHLSLLRLSQKHGPLMLLRLGFIPTLVISSAAATREVFKRQDYAFSGRPSLFAARKLSYDLSAVSFAPYGEYWRQARKLLVVVLLSSKRVRSFRSSREQEVKKVMDAIRSDPSATVDLGLLMLSLANVVVCRVAFGKANRVGADWLHELLSESQRLLAGFWVGDFFPGLGWVDGLAGSRARLEKNFLEIDRFLDSVIEEHLTKRRESMIDLGTNIATEEEEEEEEGLVQVLLRLHMKSTQGEILHCMDHIKGILVDVFIAGTDTTAATITWTMAELMRNPRVMKKLRRDLRQVVGEERGVVEEEDLEKLMYLKMVVKESLRLHPPAPLLLPRETIEACEVQGYDIPARTRVIVNAAAIAANPRDWEEPLRFWPERFEGSGGRDFRGKDFEFLPFGAGRRTCPGINFGTVLVELAVANLAHCFEWVLPDGMTPEDLDMEAARGLTMHKKRPLFLIAKPRSVLN